ncbi:MAG: DUF4328 domain-containing protein [Rhodospirillaceae bacterium]|nr:DUF4328 domain-containing protein [Rhodospirillaceae bacterium]MYH38668.1 DUF4328 domain-containing protein [Rhodospirillaceae bacterium]MYK14528.1 DUF4328 domain-containing protein [Rhodospirillaceae bacterium]
MKDPRQAHSYKGLHPLGRAVTFLLALGIVAAAVDLGHDIHLLVLLDAVIKEKSREAVLDMAAAFELGDRILFPTLGIVAVTAVAFLVWVYRANANAHALGFADLKFRPGWAVGWWFVPIVNLIQAPRVMLELYRVALAGSPAARRGRVGSAPVIVWWLLILFANGADRYGTGRIGSEEGLEPFRQALIAYIAGDVMFLAAGVLAIWLVRRITAGIDSAKAAADRAERKAVGGSA